MFWKDTHNNLLHEFLSYQRVGLIADMDGTLSHIVQQPADARVTPRNTELLQKLKSQLPIVAILSGRSAEAINKIVAIPGLVYIGNHGLERWSGGKIDLVPEAKPYLEAVHNAYMALLPYERNGVFIENKTATISVHYRQSPRPTATAKQLLGLLKNIAADHDLKLFQGRMVYELRPPIERNKGSAFESLIKEFSLDAALFLGDDTTDLPALKKAREMRQDQSSFSVGIGVISAEGPPEVREHADILVNGVEEVEELLDWLHRSYRASAT